MERCPALPAALALWGGIILAPFLTEKAFPLYVGLIGTSLALSWLLDLRMRWLALCFAFLCLGFLHSPDAIWNQSQLSKTIDDPQPAIVTVETSMTGRVGRGILGEVQEVKVGPKWLMGRKVLITEVNEGDLIRGKEFEIKGKVFSPPPKLNPFGIDLRTSLRRRGVQAVIASQTITPVSESISHTEAQTKLASSVVSLRCNVEKLIDSSIQPESAGVLKALLLGVRDDLDLEISHLLSKAGIYHILAISGLHVGIVIVLAKIVLYTIRINRRLSALMLILLVLAYVIFTGWHVSARRAFVLFSLSVLVSLWDLRVDFRNVISVSAILLLFLEPWLAWDLGFQLSVLAVMGIAAFTQGETIAPYSSGRIGFLKNFILGGILLSIGAQTFTLPLIAYHFWRIPIFAPLLNLVSIPLVTLVVAGGLEAILFMPLSSSISLTLLSGSALLLKLLIMFIRVLDDHLQLSVVAKPSALQILVSSLCLFFLLFFSRKLRLFLKVGLAGILWLLLVFQPTIGQRLHLTFLAVGDADACLIETPDGSHILYDCGPNSIDPSSTSPLLRFIKLKGIKRLDCVFITHPHSDHYGGLVDVLEDVEISKVAVGSTVGDTSYIGLLDRIRRKQVPLLLVKAGDSIEIGKVKISILAPDATCSDTLFGCLDPNRLSIVSRISFRGFSALLAGDAPSDVQNAIAVNGEEIKSLIFKVPHHGAKDSIDSLFLQEISPSFAIVTAGWRSRHHPKEETLEQLRRAGVQTLVTGVDGAISIETDGKTTQIYSVATGKRITLRSQTHFAHDSLGKVGPLEEGN